VHVAVSLAAYTGARRSEILRSQIDDVNLDAGTFTIREKKRDHSREFTFRTVPLAAGLKKTLRDWFSSQHPGGRFTLCGSEGGSLSLAVLSKAFRRGVRKSRWNVAGGYHVLRHSFASNCALKGVDQRIIDAWMGHQTDEMRRRYRHLFPEQEQQAIRSVFG
jgi:integrase